MDERNIYRGIIRSIYLAVPANLLSMGSIVMLFVDWASWALGLALGIVSLVIIMPFG